MVERIRKMFRREQRRGFTLIELLIVVAIIAILAAIAVPNFLEAQTRSKVARAKADMRTIATALESYYVDNQSYTEHNTEQDNPLAGPTFNWRGYKRLTSPIAYITSIPQDGFGDSRAGANDSGWRPATYALGSGHAENYKPTKASFPSAGVGWPANCYKIESDGPDKFDQTQAEPFFATSAFPWGGSTSNNALPLLTTTITYQGHSISAANLPYDPTNGTVSEGEIFRFGGIKPAGEIFDFLYGVTSQ